MPSTSDRCTELEQAHDALRGHTRDVARLSVMNARAVADLEAQRSAVVFLRGVAKRKVSAAFGTYKAEAAARRLSAGGPGEMDTSGQQKTWKVLFWEALTDWLVMKASQENTDEAVKVLVDELATLTPAKVIDNVRFHRPDAPEGDAPWAATMKFNATCEGGTARGSLLYELRGLFRDGALPADVAVAFDRPRDRQLTAEVAQWVDMPAKGKGKGKTKSGKDKGAAKEQPRQQAALALTQPSEGVKRASPERLAGSAAKKR